MHAALRATTARTPGTKISDYSTAAAATAAAAAVWAQVPEGETYRTESRSIDYWCSMDSETNERRSRIIYSVAIRCWRLDDRTLAFFLAAVSLILSSVYFLRASTPALE